MDKLIEILLGLQKDVVQLRSDVRILSEKIDRIAQQGASEQKMTQTVQYQKTQKEHDEKYTSYGRQLSQSEIAYLDRLHADAPSTMQDVPVKSNAGVSGNYSSINQAVPAPVRSDIANPNMIERFFVWMIKDWPMKIGGLFVVAAVGWFVTYAAKAGWLSETARVVLGYVFSVACIIFGTLRAEKEHAQGNTFLVIGIGAILISTLASIRFDLIVHGVGLFVMLVSIGLVTLISLRQKSIALTSSMIFFGAIIPLFFFSGVHINTIFMYLFTLTVGTLWIVSFTKWRSLTLFMLFVVGLYSIGYAIDAYSTKDIETVTNIIIAFLFTAIFYIANVHVIIKSHKPHAVDLMTAIGLGILFLVWILSFSPETCEVALLLIGTLFFAIASYIIYMRTSHRAPTVIYGGVSAMLFGVATALQFDGPVLVTAYAIEAAALITIILYFEGENVRNSTRTLLVMLYAMPVLMSLYYVGVIFNYLSFPQGNFIRYMPALFALFFVCVAAFGVAESVLFLLGTKSRQNLIFFRIFAYVGGAYALLLIWFITHIFMSDYDVATFVALVVYTVAGVIFYIMGARDAYNGYMVLGGVLFGIVVSRVLLVEFWEMDIVVRIITSFVLGSLLISTAFIRTTRKREL